MIFGGIQKFTILDYPDKTACTLFIIGCNFRCPYCQNASLIKSAANPLRIDEEEILDFLETRKGLLDGICISGGEPLSYSNEEMQEEPDAFIAKVKAMGFLVKLDTNGSYPDRLKRLISSGNIDYIAMDVKNSPQKYAVTIGIPEYNVSSVHESIKLLLSSGVPHEFRTTVVRDFHTYEDLLGITEWISGAEKYFLQRFVDSATVLQKGLREYSDTELRQFVQKLKSVMPGVELRGT